MCLNWFLVIIYVESEKIIRSFALFFLKKVRVFNYYVAFIKEYKGMEEFRLKWKVLKLLVRISKINC